LHSPEVVEETFKFFFNSTEYILEDEWTNRVRSVIISQVFYSKQSNYYYYTYILYEIQPFGSVLDPVIVVEDFLPNIYEYKYGNIIHVLDIIRLILVILIGKTGTLYFLKKFNEQKCLPEEEQKSAFILIFETNYFSDLYMFSLYISAFVIKVLYLSIDLEKELVFNDYKIDQTQVFWQNNFDFYNIVNKFQTQIILECLLIFGGSFKIITLFNVFPRIKIFFLYVGSAFRVVFAYFLLMLFMIISFSLFSNNLWGAYLDEYRDFSSSLTGTLLLSIGHFNRNAFSLNFTIWNFIYIFLFFMIFIYFIMSTFVGLYIEAFRLNSLKYGNSYEYRLLNEKTSTDKQKKK